MKSQAKQKIIDEFAFVLLGALVFIGIMLVFWTTPEELPPSVEPKSIYVKMLPNSQKSITFKIIGNLTSVSLLANGSISQFVMFPENNFNVLGEKDVKAVFKSPSSYGEYRGYIIIKGKGGEDAIEVKMNVVPLLSLTQRSFSIEDFRITNSGGEKTLDSKSDFVVEKSLFSSKTSTLTFGLESFEIEDAKLKLILDDASGPGYFVVKLNGNVIYRNKIESGGYFEEIPLNLSYLKEINFVRLEAENEGFGILFKTSYHVVRAEIKVKYKSYPYTFEIPLSRSEIDNFYALGFSSILVSDSQQLPSIQIKFNNQIVFIGKPMFRTFDINITKDLAGNPLLLYQNNNVSVSLISEGNVLFSNNILRIYYYSSS